MRITNFYQGDSPAQDGDLEFPGEPMGTFFEPVKDPETGVISLIENTQKKTQAQWASVRAQQRELLYESDWTCSVTDYEVPNKAEWVQYRQALRDVTTQSDPFNIEWPQRPSP
jgi:hypothetical protein